MRGHRQALKKVFGGSGCSRGQGGASSRRRKHVQRPATIPGGRHTPPESRRGGSRRRNRVQRPAGQDDSPRLTSPEPYSTTSGPGVIPEALQMPPHSRGAPCSVVHPVTTPPTRPRFHSQSATHHPRTGHPKPARHSRAPHLAAPPEPPTSTPSPPYRPLHPPHHLHRPQPQALRPVDHELSGDKTDTECRQPHDRRVRAGLAGGGSEASVITRAILQFEPFRCPICEVCGVRKCKIAGCSGGGFVPGAVRSLSRPRPSPSTLELGRL